MSPVKQREPGSAVERPDDVWRVCGRSVEHLIHGSGCVCGPFDPTAVVAVAARKRLETSR